MAQEFDFDIGNVVGPPGATGNGIKSIQLLSTSGLVKTYRITMTDDKTFDFSVSDGSDGDDGNGISGASFDPQTNELTITFDDGTSFTTPSLKGSPGTPGDDGVSPTMTVTTITGGHRVTITDRDHPSGQSFDVMDGASDAGSVTYDKTATYQSGTAGAALNDLNRQLSDLEDSISDAYDATASYAVGDFCINDNTLYRCNTAIPTGGEAWTPAHWDAVQIVDLLGSGGGAVSDVQINGTSILSDGVANILRATSSTEGVVKVNEGYGVMISNGVLFAANPSLNEIKSGALYKPPSARQMYQATFYGLAKAAGDATQSASANAVGAYTEDAKSAISEMLNGSVAVSGTTPTIAAKAGISYVCGEVATLDITLPASGCFDVVFQSGSTPTVLTATGVTWANDFDATALEADTTYEINIKDGLGVVQKWT